MDRMEHVVLATDLGPAAPALVHRLNWMAAHRPPLRVLLLHVIDRAAVQAAAQWGLGDPAALEQQSMAEAEAGLDRLRGKLRLPGSVEIESRVRIGDPAEEIAASSGERSADLLIAGSGNRLWRQALLGSTARRLVRRVSCALWLAREDAEAAQQIDRAVLAVDFGESCARAFALARRCWPTGQLEAVHVVDSALVDQAASLVAADSAELGASLCAAAQTRLDAWLAEQALGVGHARVLSGRPVRSLLAEISSSGAQALVLGRGDRADAAAAVGGIAEPLTLQAECDLLIAARG